MQLVQTQSRFTSCGNNTTEEEIMKLIKLILPLSLLFSCACLLAAPTNHYHGERQHSHNLPDGKVSHKHGSLPVGSLSKNNTKQDVTKAKEKTTSDPKMSAMDRLLMKEYIDTSIRVTGSMAYGRYADWDEKNMRITHKKNWQAKVKEICVDLANRMKSKYPSTDVYNYTLRNCVQYTFSKFQ